MPKYKCLFLFSLFVFCFINLALAQVKDTLLKPIDTIKTTPIRVVRIDSPKKTIDTAKAKYVNPGKVAARKAVFKSLIIPGWGQLYNNQLLNERLNAKGEKTGHFWQKTYTLSKVGIIYAGFTLLTISYIDSRNNYKIFLKEAQIRALNKLQTDPAKKQLVNPDLVRYGDTNVTDAQAIYKRNSQIVIFSYFAVYAVNVVDAYVAARLNYFNIDDSLSMKITPSLMSNPNSMYGSNATPALKVSLRF
ncbi:DUF5683 domain-containing protein [Pedobacter mendelii]|uniref:DUF5683 domain-containing protein n=1 Tax=Pedobacter mendelii TaxID=1908240 RepID=A0ABQ2BLL6_9SPHI|nr:DUF5683 domain-containing protein [Pedobacter mendelii]GGI27511.1 hypothetical protein GCM10008119_28020 [Pedobacter mendelii]